MYQDRNDFLIQEGDSFNYKLAGTSTFLYQREEQLQNFLQAQLKKANKKNRVMVLANMCDVIMNRQSMKQVTVHFYFKKDKQLIS